MSAISHPPEHKTYPTYPRDDWYHKYYYDMRKVVWNCTRCSVCKWVDSVEVKDPRFARVCPSHERYLFDAYSCQGRMDVSLALIDGKLDPESSPRLLDVFYRCNTCGACDAACKRNQDMEPLRVMLDMRARLVEQGLLLPQHMPLLESLKKDDNTVMGKKADRGNWAAGLDVKNAAQEKCSVIFHCGCRLSFDQELWEIPRTLIALLKRAGLDVGIMGRDEVCCGCKPFEMGYRSEFLKYAESNIEAWRNAGASTIVTACADGYYAMKRLYPEVGGRFRVMHSVEFLHELLRTGKLKFRRPVKVKATWHDPCHIGRRDTDRIWTPGDTINGLYEQPREILKAIPGIRFREMSRIREYAWCCGAGGAVSEAYPDFSQWTAARRLEEATAADAEAIITACPWCQRAFLDAGGTGKPAVLDIVQVVQKAL